MIQSNSHKFPTEIQKFPGIPDWNLGSRKSREFPVALVKSLRVFTRGNILSGDILSEYPSSCLRTSTSKLCTRKYELGQMFYDFCWTLMNSNSFNMPVAV